MLLRYQSMYLNWVNQTHRHLIDILGIDPGSSKTLLENPKEYTNGTRSTMSGVEYAKLPEIIYHDKCLKLDKTKQYPNITNVVVTVKLGVAIDLRRLSMMFQNTGKSAKFPSSINKIDGGSNLISTTGAVVTPGCESFYGAKYMAHLARLTVEAVKQPVLVIDSSTGEKQLQIRPLRGLTSFNGFRVVNVVSNGRLAKNYISLAEMEADDNRLNWNPTYFPGLEHVLTKDDVPFQHSPRASMTLFDSGKGVGMGVQSVEDSYLAYQYLVEKAAMYPDLHNVPKDSTNRFLYRQEQKRLHSISNIQPRYHHAVPLHVTKNARSKANSHRGGLIHTNDNAAVNSNNKRPRASISTNGEHVGPLKKNKPNTPKSTQLLNNTPVSQIHNDSHHDNSGVNTDCASNLFDDYINSLYVV